MTLLTGWGSWHRKTAKRNWGLLSFISRWLRDHWPQASHCSTKQARHCTRSVNEGSYLAVFLQSCFTMREIKFHTVIFKSWFCGWCVKMVCVCHGVSSACFIYIINDLQLQSGRPAMYGSNLALPSRKTAIPSGQVQCASLIRFVVCLSLVLFTQVKICLSLGPFTQVKSWGQAQDTVFTLGCPRMAANCAWLKSISSVFRAKYCLHFIVLHLLSGTYNCHLKV